MLRRIKRLWQLANKDPKALEKLESLTDAQVDLVPSEGDGKAEFFGPGTEEEWKELEREDKGFKGIFGIGK